ncbi:MAG: glycosyltransferase family 2 protein [bacterium]|nr:glycosyltransferase family 2 protein [bacterium]
MTKKNIDISFIILNYFTKGLVKNCIKSILKSAMGGLTYEVIVVDNGSFDGVKEMLGKNFSNIKFIQSQKNLGMGAGNNLGIKQARGRYVAVLNPDIIINNDSIRKLAGFFDNNAKVGLLGPKLINPDGTTQYTRCHYPSKLTPIYRRTPLRKLSGIKKKLDIYLTKDKDYDTAGPTDWVYGACLFVRKDLLETIGNFDEQFFLGFEDTDLCRRVWQAGSEVWYYPQSVLVHYPHRFSGGRGWLVSLFNKNVRIHIASWLKYEWKYRRRSLTVRT